MPLPQLTPPSRSFLGASAALAMLLLPQRAAADPGTSTPTIASSCTSRPNALIADLGMHVVNLGYARTFGCVVVAQATAGVYGPWTVNRNVLGLAGGDRHDDVLGLVLRARVFIHPLATAPGGLWVSPFVQGGPVTATRGADELGGRALAAGAAIGWTWVLADKWLIALGAGAQYHTVTFAGSAERPGFARLAPHADLQIGYTF